MSPQNISTPLNSTSDPTSPRPQKKNNKKKIFAAPNRFELLTQVEPAENPQSYVKLTDTDTIDYTNIKQPPPIFFKGVYDFPKLMWC